MLNSEYLNTRILYRDGKLFWKPRTLKNSKNSHQMNAWNARYAGKEFKGHVINSGYKMGSVDGFKILFHRLIYAMLMGDFAGEIDHIDRDKLNNRIENLRVATSTENKVNKTNSRGLSRFKGVYFNKNDDKWRAQASTKGKNNYLGNFDTEEEAALAYNAFMLKHHNNDFIVLNEV